MNNRQLTLCIAFLSLFTFSLSGQSYIVQFESKTAAKEYFDANKNDFIDVVCIGRSTNMYNVYPKAESNLKSLSDQSAVINISANTEVKSREIPNDSDYGTQWPLPLIEAEKAWNEVTHGYTNDGKEIVIAVLDNSFQIDHPDLINNIWVNEGEIPDDNIDNDNNGYVDDYYGLHVDERNDNHPVGNHGTKVSGIIGAEGNNSMGISGVNWKIKLMIISGANSSTDIIEGYNYALDQRKLYNETNGAEGAYVVATNLSAGISNQFGTNFPNWCNMYDLLGEQGILSVTATDNANYNVDEEGDMPTTCQSDYLITVTSTDRFDQKALLSAFGSENVDLGAPGDETYSTSSGSSYETFTGTSAATPHVAGAIGILYSADCPQLIYDSIDFPPSAAVNVKKAILASAKRLDNLTGITVSGGRLDLFNALSELAMICSTGDTSEREELKIVGFGPNPAQDVISFTFSFKRFENHTVSIYNSIGQLVYTDNVQPSLFSAPEVSIDVSSLRPAMYMLTMGDGEDLISLKFFKED